MDSEHIPNQGYASFLTMCNRMPWLQWRLAGVGLKTAALVDAADPDTMTAVDEAISIILSDIHKKKSIEKKISKNNM